MSSNIHLDWPEPIVRVQSLSDGGLSLIPQRYIKPLYDRPSFNPQAAVFSDSAEDIPVIDLGGLCSGDEGERDEILGRVSAACRDWGFFQVVNHGISPELMDRTREVWREFFHLPMEIKQGYTNSPKTYEGYGSRLGVEKGAILDWSDYYFLHYLPTSLKDYSKWPSLPASCR